MKNTISIVVLAALMASCVPPAKPAYPPKAKPVRAGVDRESVFPDLTPAIGFVNQATQLRGSLERLSTP